MTVNTTMTANKISRRHGLKRLAILSAALSGTWAAADDARPVEWVVGYAAGGGSDVIARVVAESLTKTLKRPVIISNKPGAATNIAAGYVARNRDFGHVLLTADFATLAANPFLFAKLPYDPEKDLASVGMIARFPLVLVVGPKIPVTNWSEFLSWAKSQSSPINYASAGPGSPHHLAAELLKERSGLSMTHVPYRGAAPAMQDVLAGNVPMMFVDTAIGNQFILSGKVRAIGVASSKRLDSLPAVPTLQEQGVPSYESYAWQGMAVGSGTSRQEILSLNNALNTALRSEAVLEKFRSMGVEALPGTPDDMTRYAKLERERWGKVIRKNNIHLD